MKVLLCSSGGKDSLLAWHFARRDPRYQIVGQLTTMAAAFDRVTMHGVRRSLLEQQAAALGLPLYTMQLGTPAPPAATPQPSPAGDSPQTVFLPNTDYETCFQTTVGRLQNSLGIAGLIFGDIFLADLRAYRDRLLQTLGLAAIYPLWQHDSRALMETFRREGFQARAVCIDSRHLDQNWCGRQLDGEFLADLPPSVDPCGENGEFHSFVFAGPGFHAPIPHTLGERVWRDPFWFQELLPAS